MVGMSKFINKYQKTSSRNKFVKTSLPIQPLLDLGQFPQEVNVYPITVNIEMKLYNSIKNLIDKNIPLQFIMFEDIIKDIVDTQDDKQIDYNLLTLYDINFIIYNTRILSYGNTMNINLTCKKCKQFYDQQIKLKDEEEVKQLQKDQGIKNFVKQELLKQKEFYIKDYEQNLLDQSITVPDSKDEVFLEFTTSGGNVIKICPPRLGWFQELKGYLIDFRKVIDEFYKPNNIEIISEEEEFNNYSIYSNLQLFIYSIDGEIVEMKDIPEIPILIKNLFTKKDITGLSELLNNYEKYNLKIPFTYTCPKCGEVIEGDATSFPFEYVFDVNSKLGVPS